MGRPSLLAMSLACLVASAASAAAAAAPAPPACNLAPVGAQPDLYYPGLFDAGPAPTGPPSNCSAAALDVPEGSAFPFWFGTATAAYQVEGAVKEGGRGVSIWDTFSHIPGKVYGNETGDVAIDFYNRFLDDIQLMRSLGIRNFRFSLAWPRLLPAGRGAVNPEGVAFYNKLIDALLANCIEPWVTLFHWDLPQPLEDEYLGWLSPRIVEDFDAYARVAFSAFGDRVKNWTTINEPATVCNVGYDAGVFAPGRCSDRSRCPAGNSTTEPQLCAYHSLLAHAKAVESFRELVPDGKITITTNMGYNMPFNPASEQDKAAAERLNVFSGGQFLDPLFTGDWSTERLSTMAPSVLPRFTPQQSAALKAAKPDFIALQYYGGSYAKYDPAAQPFQATAVSSSLQGVPLPVADSPWLLVFPASFRAQLGWLAKRYPGVPIVVTENGVDVPGEDAMSLETGLCDTYRVDFYRQYLGNASQAVLEDGVPLEGYFAWSLADNFEWADGYSKRFGLVRIDYTTLKRYYKASAIYLANLFGLSEARSAEEAMASVEEPQF